MKRRLYPNMKRMTTMFCIAIVCVTLTSLLLRLTVFSDLAVYASNQDTGDAVIESDGQFPYRIGTSVRFRNASSYGKIGIENPAENEYYMTVSVILPDSLDVIIYTGFIKPGDSLDEVKLDVELEEGTYECIAEVSAYDPSDPRYPLGREERSITVQVG